MSSPAELAYKSRQEYVTKHFIPPLPPPPVYDENAPRPPPELNAIGDELLAINPYEPELLRQDLPPGLAPPEPIILRQAPLTENLYEVTPEFAAKQREEYDRSVRALDGKTPALEWPLGPPSQEMLDRIAHEEGLEKNFDQFVRRRSRMELQYDLEEIAKEIVQCDKYYCEDLPDMYNDALLTYAELHNPTKVAELERCFVEQSRAFTHGERDLVHMNNWKGQDDQCTPRWRALQMRYDPRVVQVVDETRMKTYNKPLLDYDGRDYHDPRWFWHVGTLWRTFYHQPYNNPYVTVNACQVLEEQAMQCLNKYFDEFHPDHCFRYWAQSKMCVPGANCPYLRPALLQCVDDLHLVNPTFFDTEKCFFSIPNFQGCLTNYVPLDVFEMGVNSLKEQPKDKDYHATHTLFGDDDAAKKNNKSERPGRRDGDIQEYADDQHNYSPRNYNNFNTFIPPLKHKPPVEVNPFTTFARYDLSPIGLEGMGNPKNWKEKAAQKAAANDASTATTKTTSDANQFQEELIKEREALNLAHKSRYVPGHYGKPPTPAEVLHGEPDMSKTNEKIKHLGKTALGQSGDAFAIAKELDRM